MPHRMLIHSRRGNVILGVLGMTYLLAAATLMAILLYSVHAESFSDFVMVAMLAACAVEGCWFAVTGARNLRHH